MTSQEVGLQTKRLEAYQKLAARLNEIETTLAVMRTPFGIHKCSAFTGNTRESRRVVSIRIQFSHTSGGEVPVDLNLTGLNIGGWKFGDYLEAALNEQKKGDLRRDGKTLNEGVILTSDAHLFRHRPISNARL